jgi:hypothetical protein
VASTTLTEPLPWPNSTLLRGDATEAVARLKGELDENLVVFGSGLLRVDYAPPAELGHWQPWRTAGRSSNCTLSWQTDGDI